jgi:hypothetical protein
MAKKPIEVMSLKADTNPKSWAEAPLYWATIEYHRFWLSVDRPRLTVLSKADGQMTPVLLRDIAREYKVSRNLKGQDKKNKSEDDTAANEICNILNAAQLSFTDSLSERLARAKDIIGNIRPYTAKASSKKKTQVTESNEESATEESKTVDAASAATKFIWFMNPEGWTIFDQYAATGIGIPKNGRSALKRMDEFYTALEYEGFPRLVSDMRAFINKQAPMLKAMPAARILDTLFMARGERGAASEHGIELTKAYLGGLPQPLRQQLSDLANGLQKQFGPRPLVNCCEPIKRNKAWADKQAAKKNGECR